MSRLASHRDQLGLLLLAGTAAAVFDATFSFFAYVVIDGRYNFESLLQYIASGLLGQDAFAHGGVTGWLIATLGFALHFAISLTVAAVFLLALRPIAKTRSLSVVLGLAYGAAVWMFNTAVVLPLTGTAHEPFFRGWYIPFLADHMLLVGLPIAIILTRSRPARSAPAGSIGRAAEPVAMQ